MQTDSADDLCRRALEYAARGWLVFPLAPGSKIPHKGSEGFKNATADADSIRAQWNTHPQSNIGIATGIPSRVFVVDLDLDPEKHKNGLEELKRLEKQHGPLPQTLTVATPRGGRHLYFEIADGHLVKSGTDVLAPGIDVRGDGGYVVAPGSTVGGKPYKILNASSPAPPPQWLLESVRKPKRSPAPVALSPATPDESKVRDALKFIAAEDYDSWVRVGMALRNWNPIRGLIVWDEWSRTCPEKYTPQDINAKWQSFNGSGVSLGTVFHQAQQNGWSPGAVTEEGLRVRLASRRFNITTKPDEPEPRFSIASTSICTPGNLTTVSAGIKSGKSSFVAAMIAAVMTPDPDRADCLGVASRNPRGLAVLHLDTEQSIADHWQLIHQACRRANTTEPPPWLHSFCVTGFSVKELRAALPLLLHDLAQAHGGIHSVLLDGSADMVSDVNDPEESNAFVAELHALAIQYSCPIIGVIHFNPGTEKTRGHLGSQLERKAETNLRLDRDGDAVVVWSEKNRRAPISKDRGPRFVWSQEAGMHVSTESAGQAHDNAKRNTRRIEAEAVFERAGKATLRWSEFIAIYAQEAKLKDKTARNHFEEMVRAQVVRKNLLGQYELAT